MTPETDAAERMAFASEYMVPTEFARELERQRDEAYQKQNETYRSSKYACDYHHELKINAEKERDEAREALKHIEEYGTEEINAAVELRQKLAQTLIERDEARNECYKIKQLLLAADSDVDAYLGVCIQRDEAREKAERYRLEANAMMLQRDEAREEVRLLKGILDLIKKDTQ